MKQLLLLILPLILLLSCNDSNAPDCLKKRGDTLTKTIDLPDFDGIKVNHDFVVYISQGPTQTVTVTSGENLIPDMDFEIQDGILVITDNNSCNWVREYNFPVVHIQHPNLVSIRQNGGGKIYSEGTLNYPDLKLISEYSSGNMHMNLNCNNLQVVNNDLSNYFLSGKTDNLRIVDASGDGRIDARQLISNIANVFQRGTNDIIVNVNEKLTGRIISSGDIIYVGQVPDIIDVSIENRGELINGIN